jgi:tRNA(fMet)-specific endonuclease VapC
MTAPTLNNPIVIVDTDIFSYWVKKDNRGDLFRPYVIGRTPALVFVTVGELYYWAYKRNWGTEKVQRLENKFDEYLVLPYDEAVCRYFAIVRHQLEGQGEMINYADYWVAACALRFDCPLLTYNYHHFSRIKDIKLLGPSGN